MRKILPVFLAILLIYGAAATSIESEKMVMDLEDSKASVRVEISELTSSNFHYITGADVKSVKSSNPGMSCRVESQSIGDEIICETDRKRNFSVELSFKFEDIVDKNGEKNVFKYTHPIYRPTDRFRLKVILPEGSGLMNDENISRSISPAKGNIGSTGRRIFVEWDQKPRIGETLSYEVRYEEFKTRGNGLRILAALLLVLIIAPLVYLYWKRLNREEIEKLYSELSDDQMKIVEMLRENDGEMLQKEVVSESDYSKAKISGLVSDLVEEDIVIKEKDGRSNKLKISSSFSY
ncbi:MAG: helix-turn-helix transcriptional regulator [Candidatus Nanohaloarchaea archaeon]